MFTEGGHIEVGNPDFEVRRKGKGAVVAVTAVCWRPLPRLGRRAKISSQRRGFVTGCQARQFSLRISGEA